MQLTRRLHLTYCTNIHPGESWTEVRATLEEFLPPLKAQFCPDAPFGVGLRLSNRASEELLENNQLTDFKRWLDAQGLYVFTMNGFPYGGFHREVVKDAVHQPDWTTRARVDYTNRLARILAALLPEGLEGGISTSPLSYKPWLGDWAAPATRERAKLAFRAAALHLAEVTEQLTRIKLDTGKTIHLDLEPEPDGFLENTPEFIDFYQHWLLPTGRQYLADRLGIARVEADAALKNHVRLCYDVCHFTLVHEDPAWTFAQMAEAGIGIGKIQLSAALQATLPDDLPARQAVAQALLPFAESTYLHQVTERDASGHLTHYPDLPAALANARRPGAREWRIHFHVPLFVPDYHLLQSTQAAVEETLRLLRQHPMTHHLEVETYTWEVLPADLKLDLAASIARELRWVLERL